MSMINRNRIPMLQIQKDGRTVEKDTKTQRECQSDDYFEALEKEREDVKSFADRFTEAHARGQGTKTGTMLKKNYRLIQIKIYDAPLLPSTAQK